MVVMFCASDVIEYDRRSSEMSNASLYMKQNTTSIKEKKKTLKY